MHQSSEGLSDPAGGAEIGRHAGLTLLESLLALKKERLGFGILELVQIQVSDSHARHQTSGLGVFLAQHAAGSLEGIHGQRRRLPILPIEIIANAKYVDQPQCPGVVLAQNFTFQRLGFEKE